MEWLEQCDQRAEALRQAFNNTAPDHAGGALDYALPAVAALLATSRGQPAAHRMDRICRLFATYDGLRAFDLEHLRTRFRHNCGQAADVFERYNVEEWLVVLKGTPAARPALQFGILLMVGRRRHKADETALCRVAEVLGLDPTRALLPAGAA
jgi:tellurite resistance protein